MRIAVPVTGGLVAASLAGSEGFRFFEDDHGRVVRSFLVPRDGTPAVDQLEQYGVDALLCGEPSDREKRALAASGIMLFPHFSGDAERAVLDFLSGTVARDPANKCNACGFQSACSLKDRGGCERP